MKITLLGAGGAFTDYRKEFCTAALVEFKHGPVTVLLDCGPTVMQALRQLGEARGIQDGRLIHEIDYVLLTHLHPDHVADLGTLVFFRYYLGKKRTKILVPNPLSPHLRSLLLATILNGWLAEDRQGSCLEMVDIVEMPPCGELALNAMSKVWSNPVSHCPGSSAYGYRLFDGSSGVYWSGDCVYDHEAMMQALARDILVFHDCSMGKKCPQTVHTHVEDLMLVPQEDHRRIVLVHHGDPEGMGIVLRAVGSEMQVGARFASWEV